MFDGLDQPDRLLSALQTALELEHATIPPYLFAAYSLTADNFAIRDIIISIAMEEMLHMNLVANLIISLGGHPKLDSPDFIPKYPKPLPGSVQDGLIVPLAPFCIDLVRDVFMTIEEPEDPLVFPITADLAAAPRTIGQFYQSIKSLLQASGDDLIEGHADLQFATPIGNDQSFVITDVASAIQAIDLIIDQGEGTPTSPLQAANGSTAHYYLFESIAKGWTLNPNPNVPEKFSFGQPAIPFTPSGVYPVLPNVKMANYPADPVTRQLGTDFNKLYTAMLADLHNAFNGQPAAMDEAIKKMRPLRTKAIQLMKLPLAPGSSLNVGPTFEYTV